MSLSVVQGLLLILIAVIAMVIVFLVLQRVLPSFVRKRYTAQHGENAWRDDRASNAIQSGFALEQFLEREGIPVPQAGVLLRRAQTQFELKHYQEALDLATEAMSRMAEKRKAFQQTADGGPSKASSSGDRAPRGFDPPPSTSEEPAPKSYRDLSSRVGDKDPDAVAAGVAVPSGESSTARAEPMADPAPDGNDGDEVPLKAASRKLPKNFMEARFMLTSLQNDLAGATPERLASPEGKEAQEWSAKSQTAFDNKNYDDSLRLALRGRRRFGGAGLSTISVGPGTVVEAQPAEPTAAAQRSSAPVGTVTPAATSPTCPRCGKSNSGGDRFCRACGAPMSVPKCPRCQRPTEPEDRFCHGCGAPLTAQA